MAASSTSLTLGFFRPSRVCYLFIFQCFVLQCSKPMQKGQCPDCGKVIGGEQHIFLGEYKISDR